MSEFYLRTSWILSFFFLSMKNPIGWISAFRPRAILLFMSSWARMNYSLMFPFNPRLYLFSLCFWSTEDECLLWKWKRIWSDQKLEEWNLVNVLSLRSVKFETGQLSLGYSILPFFLSCKVGKQFWHASQIWDSHSLMLGFNFKVWNGLPPSIYEDSIP